MFKWEGGQSQNTEKHKPYFSSFGLYQQTTFYHDNL